MFNNYSQRNELVKELKNIKEQLKTTDKSDDSDISEISKNIDNLEKTTIPKNFKDAKKLVKIISNYLKHNLEEMCKTYKDPEYTKELKNLNKSQLSIFGNLEEFDNHDQAKIQSCFDNIYLFITKLFESKRRKALEDYNIELSRYELGQTKNLESIQSILAENTIQNNDYVSEIESQVQSLKAGARSLREKQKKLR